MMKMFMVILNLCFFLSSAYADVPIILQKVEKLDFETLLPKEGSCFYDANEDKKSDLKKNSTCSSFSGSKGIFKLIAKPKSFVEIEFKSSESSDGKVIFKPEGIIRVDFNEFGFYSNKPIRVNTGDTGVINIEVGGDLIFLTDMGYGENLSVDYDIKYNYVD